MWSITLIAALAFAQNPALPECEWCGAPEAPAVLNTRYIGACGAASFANTRISRPTSRR